MNDVVTPVVGDNHWEKMNGFKVFDCLISIAFLNE